jgi:heme A synthase
VTDHLSDLLRRAGFIAGLWHLLSVLERAYRELGFLIEHSHRLVGYIVGTCSLVLAIGLGLRDRRRWMRWLGVLAPVAVGLQGLLGGFRVELINRNLAFIHGCFAQIVFALLVSLVLLTSRTWGTTAFTGGSEVGRVRRWSLLTTALIFFQMVLGGIVRHNDVFWGARAHLFFAFAVVAAVVCLLKQALEVQQEARPLAHAALLLAGLVILQLFLGIETWLSRFGSGQWQQLQPLMVHPDLLRSLHYLVGSSLFATSAVVALWAHRGLAPAVGRVPVPSHRLQGAV